MQSVGSVERECMGRKGNFMLYFVGVAKYHRYRDEMSPYVYRKCIDSWEEKM
jgi:hypothetical protein